VHLSIGWPSLGTFLRFSLASTDLTSGLGNCLQNSDKRFKISDILIHDLICRQLDYDGSTGVAATWLSKSMPKFGYSAFINTNSTLTEALGSNTETSNRFKQISGHPWEASSGRGDQLWERDAFPLLGNFCSWNQYRHKAELPKLPIHFEFSAWLKHTDALAHVILGWGMGSSTEL